MKHVAVFGVFDLLHEGHKSFLAQAKELGDTLSVYLAQDAIVRTLKGRKPSQSFEERKEALAKLPQINAVYGGDTTLGNYRGISIHRPDIIALGYDQTDLERDLKDWMKQYGIEIPLVRLEAFQPETYKTSKLRENV